MIARCTITRGLRNTTAITELIAATTGHFVATGFFLNPTLAALTLPKAQLHHVPCRDFLPCLTISTDMLLLSIRQMSIATKTIAILAQRTVKTSTEVVLLFLLYIPSFRDGTSWEYLFVFG